ncbi:MAG: hypothetical protein ACETWQ_22725 [Phycisphaerae bacterium]
MICISDEGLMPCMKILPMREPMPLPTRSVIEDGQQQTAYKHAKGW